MHGRLVIILFGMGDDRELIDNNQMISQAKVVIIGSISVGKSSISKRFVTGEFDDYLESTVGAVFSEKSIQYTPGRPIKFQIWDTAGQEKYKAIARIYYKDSKAALVVYDVNNRQSFDAMKVWVSELKDNGPKNIGTVLAIVGNKIDLMKEKEEVPYNEAKEYANKLGAIFKYTSAKENKGINELFVAIAERLQVVGNTVQRQDDQRVRIGNEEKPRKAEGGGCC